jgi:hypothetical protein
LGLTMQRLKARREVVFGQLIVCREDRRPKCRATVSAPTNLPHAKQSTSTVHPRFISSTLSPASLSRKTVRLTEVPILIQQYLLRHI